MPQSSAPIVNVNLSDADWRDSFGDEAGVLGDLDGTAYKVTLPTDSDVIQVGSTTQRSVARVAGFVHRIPGGETEPLTIPAASGSSRTDIVALRYDPAFTGAPGPVRLVRIAGTSVGLPAYDAAPPGIEDLPLWSITRQVSQALSQATVTRLFPRLAPALDVPSVAPLPSSSPLGTIARQGATEFVRTLDAGNVPVWVNVSPAPDSTAPVNVTLAAGVANYVDATIMPVIYWRNAKTAHLTGTLRLVGELPALGTRQVGTLPAGFRPVATVTSPTNFEGRFEVRSNGVVNVLNGKLSAMPNNTLLPLNMVFPTT